ncbi:MAG: hypothetical protein JXC85_00265 [Candidatus Aenigmarchaeota archaeon]|nr:hypothetical protein [Candidatus Aenigmarchaeota archaeon]
MTDTTSLITVPRFELYGLGDLHRIAPHAYEGEMAKKIDNYGERLCDIHADSIELGDECALFNLFLLSELGEIGPIEGELREAIYGLFDNIGYGNVTNNACDYDKGDPNLEKTKDSDIPVLWTVRPTKIMKTGSGWNIELGEESEQFPSCLPASGYTEMTCDGLHMPVSGSSSRPRGVPFSTVNDRNAAEKSVVRYLTSKGVETEKAENFAKIAVSYFGSRESRKGTASVCRWYSNDDSGRFDVGAYYGPDVRSPCIGSFPASRSAERSEASPEGRGIKVISVEEYRALQADAEKLAAVRSALKG